MEPSSLERARARLEGLIDWERRERAPGERGQAMRVDLEPIEDLASLVGRPDRSLALVHVAGSKGKGSVASLVAAGLRAAGLRVGRYGSPHVERLNERIELDGAPIDDAALGDALEAALDAREVAIATGTAGKDATWFDVLTLAAMLAMRDAGIDRAVFECGLGGRLDSTNLLVGEVCVVTTVDLEHTEVLGDTRAEIAFEKVSIVGKAATLVTGVPPAPDEAGDVVDKHVAMEGARVLRPAWAAGPDAPPPPVDVERRNRDLAELVLDELGRRGWAGPRPVAAALLTPAVVREARLPGRLEAFAVDAGDRGDEPGAEAPAGTGGAPGAPGGPPGRAPGAADDPVTVVLDGAHVPASLAAVLDDLARRPGLAAAPVCVLGTGRDKDAAGLLKVLGDRVDTLICTSVGGAMAADPGTLAALAGPGTPALATPSEALGLALERARGRTWVLVVGSLHLAGDLRPVLLERGRSLDLPDAC